MDVSVRQFAPDAAEQCLTAADDSASRYAAVFTLDLHGGTRIFTGDGMERRVLISHAKDDPEWAPDQVEAVGLAIQQGGIRVSLDVWHQRDAKRHLSLGEWQAWMDESIDAATHILCLVSTRYRELWSRKRDVQGGFGVAFESIRLIHHLYLLKQHNDGRILTLRPEGSGYDCIPRDLALDCPAYRWSSDRDILLSHVGEAALSVSVASPEATVAAAPLVVPPAAPPAAIRQPVQVAQMPVRAAHRWAAVLPIVGKAALPVRAVPPEVPVAPVPIFVSHAAQPPATRGPTQVADPHARRAATSALGQRQRRRHLRPLG